MPAFPALKPSSRVFTPGAQPHTPRRSMGGRASQSSHSDLLLGQSLQLTFLAISSQQLQAILTHWAACRGRFGAFNLPSDVLSGEANPSQFTPAGYQWRYLERPSVDDVPCGLHDVSVTLELVPAPD